MADRSPSLSGKHHSNDEPGLGGKARLTHLLSLLDHEDYQIRLRALRQLEAHGITDAALALMPLLDDDNANVRGRAVYMLRRYDRADVTTRLIEVLHTDPDRMVRARAAKALGDHTSPEIVPALAQHFRQRYTTLQYAVIETLGRIGTPQAATALIEAYGEYPGLHHRIARVLGDIGDPRAVPLLMAGSGPLTMQQMYTLLRIADRHPEHRRRVINRVVGSHSYSRFRIAAAEVLRMVGGFPWADPLLRATVQATHAQPKPPLWLAALRHHMGDPAALADLREQGLALYGTEDADDSLLVAAGDRAYLHGLMTRHLHTADDAAAIAQIAHRYQQAGHSLTDDDVAPLRPFVGEQPHDPALVRLLHRFDPPAFRRWQADHIDRIFIGQHIDIGLLQRVVQVLFWPGDPAPQRLYDDVIPLLLDHARRYAPSAVITALTRIVDPAVSRPLLARLRALDASRDNAYQAAGYSTVLAAHGVAEVIHLTRPWLNLPHGDAPLDMLIENLVTIAQKGHARDATAVLRRQVRRASPHLRPRVIGALGRIAHPTAIPALVPLLHARTGSAAYRALTALERIGLANSEHSAVQTAIRGALETVADSTDVIARLSSYDITVGAYAAQIVRSLTHAHPD